MEKFNRTLRGYDPEEVNAFLDQVIERVEKMIVEIKEKDILIAKLQEQETEYLRMKDKLDRYERMEETLNKAILMAQKTSDQMRVSAQQESDIIIDNAKKNASRIVNEALMRAEQTEFEANQLKKNINVFKRRMKDIIESQLQVVDDIEKVDL